MFRSARPARSPSIAATASAARRSSAHIAKRPGGFGRRVVCHLPAAFSPSAVPHGSAHGYRRLAISSASSIRPRAVASASEARASSASSASFCSVSARIAWATRRYAWMPSFADRVICPVAWRRCFSCSSGRGSARSWRSRMPLSSSIRRVARSMARRSAELRRLRRLRDRIKHQGYHLAPIPSPAQLRWRSMNLPATPSGSWPEVRTRTGAPRTSKPSYGVKSLV